VCNSRREHDGPLVLHVLRASEIKPEVDGIAVPRCRRSLTAHRLRRGRLLRLLDMASATAARKGGRHD
jgi:hypothetical protein